MDELALYATDLSTTHSGNDSSLIITWIYYWLNKQKTFTDVQIFD